MVDGSREKKLLKPVASSAVVNESDFSPLHLLHLLHLLIPPPPPPPPPRPPSSVSSSFLFWNQPTCLISKSVMRFSQALSTFSCLRLSLPTPLLLHCYFPSAPLLLAMLPSSRSCIVPAFNSHSTFILSFSHSLILSSFTPISVG